MDDNLRNWMEAWNQHKPSFQRLSSKDCWKYIYETSCHRIAELPIINEEKKDLKGMADTAASVAQPISHHTFDKDQDLTDKSIGATFTDEDLARLAELKNKLHDAIAKDATMTDDRKTEEIEKIKKQIDDLSDSLGRFKHELGPQSD